MPYANIHWIKIKLEILQDKRFLFDLDDGQKMLFLGLIILAGATKNEVPDDENFLKNRLNLLENTENIRKNIQRILEVYPKTVSRNGVIKFKNFNELHNRIGEYYGIPTELQGNSKGNKDKIRVDKKRIDILMGVLLKAQGWDKNIDSNPYLLTELYKRHGRALKSLILVANDDSLAAKAIETMADRYAQKGLNWTIETVIKHFGELIKDSDIPEALQKWTKK